MRIIYFSPTVDDLLSGELSHGVSQVCCTIFTARVFLVNHLNKLNEEIYICSCIGFSSHVDIFRAIMVTSSIAFISDFNCFINYLLQIFLILAVCICVHYCLLLTASFVTNRCKVF